MALAFAGGVIRLVTGGLLAGPVLAPAAFLTAVPIERPRDPRVL